MAFECRLSVSSQIREQALEIMEDLQLKGMFQEPELLHITGLPTEDHQSCEKFKNFVGVALKVKFEDRRREVDLDFKGGEDGKQWWDYLLAMWERGREGSARSRDLVYTEEKWTVAKLCYL